MESKERFYSTVFKEKAVSLSCQRDNLKELADELGINVQRLYKWRTSMKSTPPIRATSGDPMRSCSFSHMMKTLFSTSKLICKIK